MLRSDIKNSYRLPWSEYDNPNGWIEPTNACNIICPGCYRGIENTTNHITELPLEELKRQIDWLKAHRNVHTISIAGGEPTLYPHLHELIAYAAQSGLRTMMFTNGLLLTRELAINLAECGLNQVVIHIDRFQQRPDLFDSSTIELRQKFVHRLKDIPNLNIGFIQPVSRDCGPEVDQLMEFLKQNFSAVNLMIFTIYRNICESCSTKPERDDPIDLNGIAHFIKRNSEFIPVAYLPSKSDSKAPTWLFSQRMGLDGAILGSVSPALYKVAHTHYRKKTKRYLFISRSNGVKIVSLLRFSHKSLVFKIILNYLRHGLKTGRWNTGRVNFQTFLLLRGPVKQNGEWDLCDGCPDSMIYNGKVLPSCILENIKGQPNDAYPDVNYTNTL